MLTWTETPVAGGAMYTLDVFTAPVATIHRTMYGTLVMIGEVSLPNYLFDNLALDHLMGFVEATAKANLVAAGVTL